MTIERGKASIVILCGTSTAGKTTICQQVENQGKSLGLKWAVDGGDLWAVRLGTKVDAYYLDLMKAKESCKAHVESVIAAIGNHPTASAVMEKKIISGTQEISLIKNDGLSISQQAEEIFNRLTDADKKKYDKKTIASLLHLVKENMNLEKEHRFPFEQHDPIKEIFDDAIDNSRKGIPTIIDVVPMSRNNQNIIEEFFQHLKDAHFSCPTVIAIIHCSTKELIPRMAERNRQAMLRGDRKDIRDKFFPFEQYAELYGRAQIGERHIVGEVNRSDIETAWKKYGAPVSDKNSAEFKDNMDGLEEFMRRLEFPVDQDQIPVKVKHYEYDTIYQNGSSHQGSSPREIAHDLCRLATNTSFVPADKHPVAALFDNALDNAALKAFQSRFNEAKSEERNTSLSEVISLHHETTAERAAHTLAHPSPLTSKVVFFSKPDGADVEQQNQPVTQSPSIKK